MVRDVVACTAFGFLGLKQNKKKTGNWEAIDLVTPNYMQRVCRLTYSDKSIFIRNLLLSAAASTASSASK